LVHLASAAFAQVALYFENSILGPDLPLLGSAAAAVDRVEQNGPKLIVASRHGVGVPWVGPALVNGKLWPVGDGETVWLPAGPATLEPAQSAPIMRLIDFNGELKTASSLPRGLAFAYQSNSRALAKLDGDVRKVEVDGVEVGLERSGDVLLLPRGQHVVDITAGR
jgi:hypothetical protein